MRAKNVAAKVNEGDKRRKATKANSKGGSQEKVRRN